MCFYLKLLFLATRISASFPSPRLRKRRAKVGTYVQNKSEGGLFVGS